ncbi:MAG: biopolymer transporter ExbD [Ignavibacteriaceae bacterium]|nr:biopolymer transporter ExbD [Ignavibacteriaceae bacterium]
MKFEMTNKPLVAFSVSSLTDIVMLLLIFFLLTSQFVLQTGVKIKLPGAKNNEQLAPSKLVVTLSDKGEIFVGDEKIQLEMLAGKLSQVKASSPENNLILRADKSVPVELVIKVIDSARGIGIQKFTIETEKINL